MTSMVIKYKLRATDFTKKEVPIILKESNGEIVESVQNISAITEQVSAHASETFESSQKNVGVVEQVGHPW